MRCSGVHRTAHSARAARGAARRTYVGAPYAARPWRGDDRAAGRGATVGPHTAWLRRRGVADTCGQTMSESALAQQLCAGCGGSTGDAHEHCKLS